MNYSNEWNDLNDSNYKDPAPGREGLPTCRECRLPARLRDPHFLQIARKEGQAMLKTHILRELGQGTFDAMGGDHRGVMDWVRTKLRWDSREKN